MNVDGRLSALVDSILRFEARLARMAGPLARALDRPPQTRLARRRPAAVAAATRAAA